MNEDRQSFRPLVSLHQVQAALKNGTRIGPVDWVLGQKERVHVQCATAEQWTLLSGLLAGTVAPVNGYTQEGHSFLLNTDRLLWDRMDINRGLNDLLEKGTLPEHVWLDSGKVSIWVLLDRLGLEAHVRRTPLRHSPPLVRERYWVFRFIAAETDLLLGRDVFSVPDPVCRGLLAQRWAHWPGTVLAACPAADLPGPVKSGVRLDEQGHFS